MSVTNLSFSIFSACVVYRQALLFAISFHCCCRPCSFARLVPSLALHHLPRKVKCCVEFLFQFSASA